MPLLVVVGHLLPVATQSLLHPELVAQVNKARHLPLHLVVLALGALQQLATFLEVAEGLQEEHVLGPVAQVEVVPEQPAVLALRVRQIQVVAAALEQVLVVVQVAKAAPVSSLSSIKHHHKRYLRLKDLVSGLFQPV